jgi:hypothetical protein
MKWTEGLVWDVNNCCEVLPGWYVHVFVVPYGGPYGWSLSRGSYTNAAVLTTGTISAASRVEARAPALKAAAEWLCGEAERFRKAVE